MFPWRGDGHGMPSVQRWAEALMPSYHFKKMEAQESSNFHRPPVEREGNIRQRPFIDSIAVQLCTTAKKHQTYVKEVFYSFLCADNPVLTESRRYWGVERGLNSTMEIVRAIKELTHKSEEGRAAWCHFILKEVILVYSLWCSLSFSLYVIVLYDALMPFDYSTMLSLGAGTNSR